MQLPTKWLQLLKHIMNEKSAPTLPGPLGEVDNAVLRIVLTKHSCVIGGKNTHVSFERTITSNSYRYPQFSNVSALDQCIDDACKIRFFTFVTLIQVDLHLIHLSFIHLHVNNMKKSHMTTSLFKILFLNTH